MLKSLNCQKDNYINENFITIDADLIRRNIYFFFGIFIFSLLLFLFGIGKNLTAFFIYFLYGVFQKLCPQILNGGDNFLKFILLYLAFADSFNYFSIEKYDKVKLSVRNFFSNLAGYSICIHLCLIYFVSAIHKIHSDVWFHGVATYYTFNLERFNGTFLNYILARTPLFVVLSTYATWLLELVYPILIWITGLRKYIIACAILLHAGIGLFMMLYDFQLIFIIVQGFFVSNNWFLMKYKRLMNIFMRYKFQIV